MKNIKTSLSLLFTLAALLTVSCGKEGFDPDKPPITDQAGQISLTLAANTSLPVVNTKADDGVNVKDFAVAIKDQIGGLKASWDSYSQIEGAVSLEAGDYTIEAYNGAMQIAAFDAPYYLGRTAFTVTPQALTPVTLECTLANTKVTIEFTQKFMDMIDNGEVFVTNNLKDGTLDWTPAETRAAYFKVNEDAHTLNIAVEGNKKSDGVALNKGFTISDVSARQWHKITIDVITAGSITHGITVSDELNEKEVVILIPDADDIIDNNGDQGSWDDDPIVPEEPGGNTPKIIGQNYNGSTFDLSQPITISKAAAEGAALDVLFKSSGAAGIQNLKLRIISTDLSTILPDQMDLANPDPEASWYGVMTGVGLLDPNAPILGKQEHLFSVGGLMGMLANFVGTHTFELEITDANGTATASLTINIVN